jgi:hypothetical protein
MFDTKTLLKARLEITRLNGELHALHLEEERCKLKRSRLEADKARVQALVDFGETVERLNDPMAVGSRFTLPGKDGKEVTLRIEDCYGAKLAVVDKPIGAAAPAPGRQKHKPAGLPTMAEMVLAVLEREAEGMRPRDIAQAVRGTWWPDAPPAEVGATAWRLAGQGRLERSGGRYKLLNGHA